MEHREEWKKYVVFIYQTPKKGSDQGPKRIAGPCMLINIYPNTPTTIANKAANPKVTLSCFSLLIIFICIFTNSPRK